GDPLSFSVAGPPGMDIDRTTGLLRWVPAADQIGRHAIAVLVLDPEGNGALEAYEIDVRAANRDPVITSSPVTAAAAGAPYRDDVRASDADGDALTFTLEQGPGGMAVDERGRMTWAPGPGDTGTHAVRVRVADGRGGSAVQGYEVTVTADTQAPRVE